jgi:hypothetical protein
MNTDTIRTRFEQRADDLRSVIRDTVTDLRTRREELQQHGEKTLFAARDRIRVVEVEGLESAADLIGRARTRLGERATVLKRGEEALNELIVNVKAGQEVTLPLEGFDDLSIKKIEPHLDGLALSDLRVLRLYEVENKNRVTLIKEIDARIEALDEEVVAA